MSPAGRARRVLPALAAAVLLACLPSPTLADPICLADRNGNGDAADPGETATCGAMAGGQWQCPLDAVSCTADAAGGFACPFGPEHACVHPAGGGVPTCSPHACIDMAANPPVEEPPVDDPGAPADGAVDAAGNCLGAIEIFGGRAMRCRPAGLGTTFANCCADKGRIVRDGMGGSATSAATKVAVAKSVFTGVRAAFTAFRAGASAGQAASAGANAIIIGLDPTSIAISLAINFMIEVLLQGCDAQDMEVGMLRGSGMCHEIGSYCSTSVLGVCIQKARGHCCFNTRLGRIIQEQGRPQLTAFNALGWGTPKQPLCRGFTPEEFQALDFSRIDLSEYYAEIEARAPTDIQIDMKARTDAYLKTNGR
jgi:conjugal transfer mating pair stabilization protein TraN